MIRQRDQFSKRFLVLRRPSKNISSESMAVIMSVGRLGHEETLAHAANVSNGSKSDMLTQRASGQARARRTSADHPEFTGSGLRCGAAGRPRGLQELEYCLRG